MGFSFDLQLFGGGGGGGGGGSSEPVKQSAPGSVALPTVNDANSTNGKRVAELINRKKGQNFTNVTQGQALSVMDNIKKTFLGE